MSGSSYLNALGRVAEEGPYNQLFFLSQNKETANTTDKGCSPPLFAGILSAALNHQGGRRAYFALTSVQLAHVALAPLKPMKYSASAPPLLHNVEAQKTL